MKVLSIQVDVTNLSEEEIENLHYAMLIQTEDTPNANILNEGIREIDETLFTQEVSENLH